jgi:hypothetical protein
VDCRLQDTGFSLGEPDFAGGGIAKMTAADRAQKTAFYNELAYSKH